MVTPTPRVPPVPGPSNAGDLYTDQATNTIWLGVDNAVNPDGMVLISDLDSTFTAINQVETNTNAALALKAPLASPVFTGDPRAPTPLITDNDTSIATTAFVKSVVAGTVPASQFVTGMILMWSGNIDAIGVGPLAGWWICDGTHGTPNLTDRFIVGALNKPIGAFNSMTAQMPTMPDPAKPSQHQHTITGTALTLAQIPAHTHSAGTLKADGSTSAASPSTHTHDVQRGTGTGGALTYLQAGNTFTGASSNQPNAALADGAHTHLIDNVDIVGITGSAGSTTSHTHGTDGKTVADGTHEHLLTSANVREVLPYYALAYIMKL